MTALRLIALIAVATLIPTPAYLRDQARITPSAITTQLDCQQILDEFTSETDWAVQLVDPLLTSEEEIGEHFALYLAVYNGFVE